MSKKNAILAEATRLFSRKGFKDTSMAELSRATGVAGGTIFHHFKNKEDLFLNSLQAVKDTILSQFAQHVKTSRYENGMEMVEGVIGFYLDFAKAQEDQLLLIHRHYPYRIAETNPVCRAHLEAVYNCLLDIFEAGISMGVRDGSLSTSSPRNTAMVLFAMVDGVVRMNTYSLYDAGSLYDNLMDSCRKILGSHR